MEISSRWHREASGYRLAGRYHRTVAGTRLDDAVFKDRVFGAIDRIRTDLHSRHKRAAYQGCVQPPQEKKNEETVAGPLDAYTILIRYVIGDRICALFRNDWQRIVESVDLGSIHKRGCFPVRMNMSRVYPFFRSSVNGGRGIPASIDRVAILSCKLWKYRYVPAAYRKIFKEQHRRGGEPPPVGPIFGFIAQGHLDRPRRNRIHALLP